MRSMADIDSEPDDQPKRDPEVTLGMGSLLGIFFGLVVLCGVFFGFGYKVGRRFIPASTAAATVHSPKAAPATSDGTTSPSEPPTEPQAPSQAAKPSANGPGPRPSDNSSADIPPARRPSPPGKPVTVPVPGPPVSAASDNPVPPHPAERSPSNSAFPDYMVQIAAISRPADGDALIAALRKRGYNVSGYTEPQDKLLHVQIGPFTTKAEANAMRQKLLADGYNAIIK